MNFIHQQPIGLNYSQRFMASVGYKIRIHYLNMSLLPFQKSKSCDGSGIIIRDKYAAHQTLFSWTPCKETHLDGLWSTLNVLKIDAWNFDGRLPPYYFEYSIIKGIPIIT